MYRLLLFFCLFASVKGYSEQITLKQKCESALKNYKSYFKEEILDQVCEKAIQEEGCISQDEEPIFHIDYASKEKAPKKILVISLIHGDETPAGGLGRLWLERLQKLEPRNTWRVIPVANPDGVKNKTRINANGVDLNRNFPTADWTKGAQKNWVKDGKSNRRFPGKFGGSEPEVKCLVKHLESFNPDFVVSIHTPLKVLDFDGPKSASKIKYGYLPWKTLGNFPGSLGRYLWAERKVPVLTTELKDHLPKDQEPLVQLQDLIGTLVKADFKK